MTARILLSTVLALTLLSTNAYANKRWNPEYLSIMIEYLYREHHEVQSELDALVKQRQLADTRELAELQLVIENKVVLCNSIVTLYNNVASRAINQTSKTEFPVSLEPFLCTR